VRAEWTRRARRLKETKAVPEPPGPLLLNAGCGADGAAALPPYFADWRHLRVDIDPLAKPDLVADVSDLSAIPDGSVDAVWSAHCIEHLFPHEVPRALAEFRRVMAQTGFACIIVPDLQAIAEWITTDRLHEVIYDSAAGPVTAHDMVWGFGPAIARGNLTMAHRCGFTPTLFLERLNDAGFPEIVLRRRSNLELAALVFSQGSAGSERRENLLSSLAL
jgi:SAM-dependent methyltransferase